ncbi:MAG: hypothetical protein HPY73_07250 [Methanomassiliicoccales archaeon]|nr:MAG: hypothetical protein HPY73_07250 [Methanomassiliicoccales archaeon]
MATKWGDALVLTLLGIGAVLLIMVALMNLDLLVLLALLAIGVIIIMVALLAIVGVIAAIPLYMLKRGGGAEPGNYRLDDVRSVKEDEKR